MIQELQFLNRTEMDIVINKSGMFDSFLRVSVSPW